jgi:hypothetical protein
MANPQKIGSYSPPDDSEEKPAPKTPAGAMSAGIKEDLKQSVKVDEEGIEKAKSYEELLAEAKVSLDDARCIVDDMLSKGFYEETVPLTQKLTVTLRTRKHADYLRYHEALEIHNPRYQEEQNEMALRYCLAGSLVRFHDQNFVYPKVTETDKYRKAFDERLAWIEQQPERVIALLAVKLNNFDRKVATVLSEGVIENF